VKDVPKILEKVGDGVYTKMDLQFSRRYSLDKLMHQMGEKVYTVFLWLVSCLVLIIIF